MSEETLYVGPDRGHFMVVRLTDDTGVYFRANCRIKDAVVFNFLSDLRYAIVGYTIEFWKDGEKSPHEGGVTIPYIPKNRPNVTKLYFRTKSSHTGRMLYLEDAIINDFLNSKVQADPMRLLTYSQEAAEQTVSAAMWRVLEGTPYSYSDAVHITRFNTTIDSPLTIESEGMRFSWKRTTDETGSDTILLSDYKFTKTRDCYSKLKDFFEGSV